MKVAAVIISISLLFGCSQSYKHQNEKLSNNRDSLEKYSYTIIENSVQVAEIKKELLIDTKRIMALLSIGTRLNLYKDDPLLFVIDSSLNSFNTKFTSEWGLDSGAIALSLRWAKSPKIRVSTILKSVLLKETDTTSIVYLKAKTIILHELVHYLQKAPAVQNPYPTSLRDHQMAMKNLREFEAYSVSSFYFLEHYDKNTLKEIMSTEENIQTKCYLIMDVVADILYPINPCIGARMRLSL